MTRKADVLFTLAILALDVWAVMQAREWTGRTQVFPYVVGVAMLVLLVVQLALSIRGALAPRRDVHGPTSAMEAARANAAAVAEAEEPSVAPEVARRRAISIVSWILAFTASLWLLGFAVGGTLASFAYLRFTAREGWRISLGLTAGTALFFYVTQVYLDVPYSAGLLFERLGI